MKEFTPFAVSYEKISASQTNDYKMVIIEPDHYNSREVKKLKDGNTRVIAYLSLGQVSPGRWYFSSLKERGFLDKNENWNSYHINLRDSVVQEIFKEQILPELVNKGFDGFFLDTLNDAAPYTDRFHLKPHMISLIRYIHEQYPEKLIIQNAGYFLLEQTSSFIDAVLVESVTTAYNFSEKTYKLERPSIYKEKVQVVDSLSSLYKKPFLVVDFAKGDSLKKLTISRLDTLPYPYFIGGIELNDISKSVARSKL